MRSSGGVLGVVSGNLQRSLHPSDCIRLSTVDACASASAAAAIAFISCTGSQIASLLLQLLLLLLKRLPLTTVYLLFRLRMIGCKSCRALDATMTSLFLSSSSSSASPSSSSSSFSFPTSSATGIVLRLVILFVVLAIQRTRQDDGKSA